MSGITLPDVFEFEWDEGNSTKSWIKHRVSAKEQEETFFDKNKKQGEDRFLLFAKTKKGRKLIVAFTIRERKIRCISARPMNRKEVPIYEKAA